MLRGIVSVLLMPMVMLSQWASIAHCHQGHHPHGHGSMPHLHIGGDSAHDTGHHHHDGHGHHHHHHDQQRGDQEQPGDAPTVLPHHDDDAVYFPLGSVTAGVRLRQSHELHLSLLAVPVTAPRYTTLGLESPDIASARTHPPPDLPAGSCPLYLQTLSLLI